MRVSLACAVLVLLGGCEDVRRFSGNWAGPVSGDPAHRQGFGADAVLRVSIIEVTRSRLDATVQLPGAEMLRFEPIRHAADDVLADMRLDGEPLRTYLGWLQPRDAAPYLVVVSIYPEERIEARVIRGPEETYGVFSLVRAVEPR